MTFSLSTLKFQKSMQRNYFISAHSIINCFFISIYHLGNCFLGLSSSLYDFCD